MRSREAGIEFLKKGRLLRAELDRAVGIGPLRRQPAVVAGTHAVVVEDPLPRLLSVYHSVGIGEKRANPPNLTARGTLPPLPSK